MVVEDLHWLDPTTLDLQQLLIEQGATAPLMLLYTARPEFRTPWPLRAHHTQIILDRLNARNVREMIAQVAARKALADETVTAVVERTSGVPLFVEELTRVVLESGAAKFTDREIPATLHDSLMARVDRLGSSKEVLQIGAAIGREFSYKLLRAVHPIPDERLQKALLKLTDSELLYVRGIVPGAIYIFKHALIRDAAYEALLKSRRRTLHQRIALALEEQFPEVVAATPERLAYHYTEAGIAAQALRYWRRAGRKATEHSANLEAIVHLSKALELLKTLPPTPERGVDELRLQLALTVPLIAMKGPTASEVERACKRAVELSHQVEDERELFWMLGALNSIHNYRNELNVALEVAKRMLRIAEAQRDPMLLLWGHYSLGFDFASLGIPESARHHLEQSIALYDPRRGGRYGYVQDPGPTGMALLANTIYQLGYADLALDRIHQALTLARSLSHPFTLASVLGSAGELYWRRGEKLAAKEMWEERLVLSTQHAFNSLLPSASLFLGYAMVADGMGEPGIAKMRAALDASLQASPIAEQVRGLALFALALGKVGQPDRGLERIDEALTRANQVKPFGDFYLLYLIKGRLLLMKNTSVLSEARQCFNTAIEVAREHKAKSDELGAAIPLAKLLVQQGHRDEARTTLADIYNWFTEGFDTADLKEAKVLLEELAK
jgi:tetratricopeptide (TPR) repeat protein